MRLHLTYTNNLTGSAPASLAAAIGVVRAAAAAAPAHLALAGYVEAADYAGLRGCQIVCVGGL
jgi:hypothetical protein